MPLKTNLFKMTTLSIADTIILKILATLAFAIVTHLLPIEHIGIIGVTTGYLVFFRLISIAPESILFRDLPKIKNKLSEYLSAFTIFWMLKTIILMALAGIFSYVLFLIYGNILASAYFFGTVFIFSLGTFHGIGKETLLISFKQGIAVKFSLILSVLTVALTFLLFFSPTLISYLYIVIVANLIAAVTWFYLLKKHLSFSFKKTKDTFKIINYSIKSFAIWLHIGGSMFSVMLTIDVLILSFFATLGVVGDYTIALTVSNFFFVVPMLLQKSTTIGLSNISDKKTAHKAINMSIKYCFFLSAIQMVFFIVFGKLIISIFTQNNIDTIYLYSLLIIAGINILNVFRPLHSITVTKIEVSKHVKFVIFPTIVISVASYILLTILYGPVGTAAGNIVAYGSFAALLVIFIKKEYPMKFEFKLITAEEKELIKSIKIKIFG